MGSKLELNISLRAVSKDSSEFAAQPNKGIVYPSATNVSAYWSSTPEATSSSFRDSDMAEVKRVGTNASE